ncbi:hypothetical protein COY90_00115 [Candidatus Roizmanbacteria bacterium CG_4_10_14_0_8_um_filter_39_9]|uniref:Uncharacterized protein n=1 Tax=Candidatus Roizmanbacteria bacterium CG_4_10_14_0_8_um_filter_39_9 TaxID=1974829 RepID=A0A2M7QF51_9BACT|nr:MAG: hypothetical protein COY90_00115 [Candidatus Roizmanbacteria bacterium CG_4_10_14_0_8_um_filter_39_9]
MTLTEVSFFSRKFAPFVILVVVVIFILFYSVKLIILYSELNQPKIVELNPIFKEIRPVEITDATTSATFSYSIDTVDGEPVTATDTAKVFFLPKNQAKFGYREKMYLMAKQVGIDTEVIKHRLENSINAIFEDGKRRLLVDITNFNFKYEVDIVRSPELFMQNETPDKDTAQNRAIDFLKSIDRYPDDLQKGRMNVIFFKYDKESSKTAVLEDNTDANMVEIDFYRADIDQFPIVSPSYFNSRNYVTMVVTNNDYQVVNAQVRLFEKSDGQVGLYPVIDGKTAYKRLQAGKGFIVSGSKLTTSEISIKHMFMGYYDPDTYQEYLQPVYVFLGDNNFVAYVVALTDKYLIDLSKL